MSKKSKSARRKARRRTEVSRKLLVEYILTFFGTTLGIYLAFVVGAAFCDLFIWQPSQPLYRFLKFIEYHSMWVLAFCFMACWILVTYHFIKKLLRYLDEVATAAEKLVVPNTTPIVLSNELNYIESQLNRAREKAINNARAAKDAEQRKNDLVVYLAHDLKTPLTSVIGYLTLLRDEGQISPELRQKYLSISLDKAERLEDLINEFFEITRFNLSHITLEYSRVNMTRLLEQLTFEFKPMLLDKNLRCTLDIAPDTMVKCDVDKIQRVFDNLLRNAVNYSFEDGEIHITAQQKDKLLKIRFTNQGNTIPQEKLNRIFEQFYRLDSARNSKSGGAGLGLAIAKEIVELHHGTITARSEDEIIEFEVTLPME